MFYKCNGGEKYLYKLLNKLDRLEDIEKLRIEKAANPRQLPLKGEFWSMFLGSRDLEASAFVNVNWSNYRPHLWSEMLLFVQLSALSLGTDERRNEERRR